MPRLKIYLSERDGLLPNTWLDDIATNEEGSKEVEEIFGSNAFFTAPKPTNLIKYLLKLGTDKDDIVLDFFAGSGSTAHAVLDLNKESGSNRKFICVQLAEPIEVDSIPHKKGFQSIADISINRIKAVIEGINSAPKNLFSETSKNNLGVRVFKLEKSNFKMWVSGSIKTEDELVSQIKLFNEQIVENPIEHNMLFELVLKSGYGLSSKIKTWESGNKKVYHSEEFHNAFSFSEVDQEVIDFLLKLKPNQFICLDKVFKSEDSIKTNIQLKLEDNGISFKTI